MTNTPHNTWFARMFDDSQVSFFAGNFDADFVGELVMDKISHVWRSTLTIPFVCAVCSVLLFIVQAWKRRGRSEETATVDNPVPTGAFFSIGAEYPGGTTTAILNAVRLASCVFLLASAAFTTLYWADDSWLQCGICITYGYAACLGIWALLLKASSATLARRHLDFVLIVPWLVFLYRDIWPLATFTLQPADAWEGPLLWVEFGVLTLAAVIAPLVLPRQYVPYDPKDPSPEPSPEQTASIFSRLFVGFLDPLVLTASRGPHVTLDKLPTLCDSDSMKNLADRCLTRLDPTKNTSKTHIYWILLRIFAWEHVELVFMLILMDLAYIGSPLAVNHILSYLETGGKDAVVKPWFWISMLFFAPMGTSLTSVRYMSVVLKMTAQVQGVVTELIFEHALRVRLKADVGDSGTEVESTASTVAPSVEEPNETSAVSDAPDSSTIGDGSTTVADQSQSGSSGATDKDKEGTTTEGSNMIGKINNLVTTDANAIENANDLLLLLFMTPFQLIFSIGFLYTILGWSVFAGLATMILLAGVPGFVAKLYYGVQADKMKKTDARVQIITEVMGGAIRMVKLFGWETRMSERIDRTRREELKAIWKLKMYNLLNKILNNFIPITTMVVTFVTYTLVMKRDLTASVVFPAMNVFHIIQDFFSESSYQITLLLNSKISLDRINQFLHETELLDEFSEPFSTTTVASNNDPGLIGVRSTSFTWDVNTSKAGPGATKRSFKLWIDNEVIFKKGHINLIVGPTGSGKTSMLMALLGEMHSIPLDATSFVSLPREDGIAYHAQESWVLNDTIQNNILFGSTYDEERYRTVLRQCALERDLALFDAGDQTEVGERGITLSGGQKARVTLARAVYSSAQILLLDDVLAALDVHTAQWLVDKCFKGDLIQGRTVILVTHNVALAQPIADFVVGLRDGVVVSQGTLSNALAQDTKLSADAARELEQLQKTEEDDAEKSEGPPTTKMVASGKLVVEEEISEGHVGWTALKLLFGNYGSGFGLILFWFTFVGSAFASRVATVTESWVVGVWAHQYELHDPQDVPVPYFLGLYLACVGVALLLIVIGNIVHVTGTLRASRIIHRALVDSVLSATLRWLDKTPSSRIVARCTQDINAVDNSIVHYVQSLTDMISGAIVRFGVILIMSPIFGVPGALMCVIGVWIGQLYMKAQLAVKRERSNARSPILGHIGAAISGLVSIRAYGAQDAFRQESFQRIDRYTRATITYNNLYRWISVRAEALASAFSTALAAYLVYGLAYDASRTGFSLGMAVSFAHVILWIVRYFNEFEVEGNSLERIHQYLVIDHEPKPVPEGIPPASWPTSGDLVVENLSARYSMDGPEVLHDISFRIQSGERVGIVGRTGSGKSSLTLALLRCILTEGKVYYSGLLTESINTDALRSHITIIPQVPELLAGTLRDNIDPFSQWDDATLNGALASAGLFSLQDNQDEGSRLNLDSPIATNGGNLSVGQRQIIALARAIVRQSKLLILDEATSAIDYETDSVIQQSLRKEVEKGVTLLTIAHRLQTIMDYDKIMVLEAGHLVEFGKPRELLEKENGVLRSLVDASGDWKKLYRMTTEGPT